MPHMQPRAAGIREHVEDVVLGRGRAAGSHGIRAMPLGKGMLGGHGLARIKGAKGRLRSQVCCHLGSIK
jgi:hypothetical protein